MVNLVTLTASLSFIGTFTSAFKWGSASRERTVLFISPDRTVLPQ